MLIRIAAVVDTNPDDLNPDDLNPDPTDPDDLNPDDLNPDDLNPDDLNPDQINADSNHTDARSVKRLPISVADQSDLLFRITANLLPLCFLALAPTVSGANLDN